MQDQALRLFISTYASLNKNNLDSLREVYAPNVQFQDPSHCVQGVERLIDYFKNAYRPLLHCHFDIQEQHLVGEDAWLVWQMNFAHPRLRGGASILVEGASHLKLLDQVVYHRDYFDMGQMLYENIPLLGLGIGWMKRRINT